MRIYSTEYKGRTTWACMVDGLTLNSNVELTEAEWHALAEEYKQQREDEQNDLAEM